MTTPDTLFESLLDLHYGLLSEAEAAHWRQRIANEPEVARVWAGVLQQAELMAQAARLEGVARPPLPTAPGESVSPAIPPQKVTLPPRPVVTPLRWRPWWLAVAAAIAFFLTAVAVWRATSRVELFPQLALRLEVVGEPNAPGQPPNRFQFRTSRHEGGAVPAVLDLKVGTAQVVLFQTQLQTDVSGVLEFALPANLCIPRDATLQVSASAPAEQLSPATTQLPVASTRCLAYLTTDRPLYRPGEAVYYRALALERYSLRADLDLPLHFELLDPSGAVVPGSVREGVTQRGVGNGAFRLPQSSVGGEYTLVARSLDGFFPEERRTFLVRAYRVPRFKKDLEFRRESYGPGDTVEADFAVSRVEGGALRDAPLAVRVMLDGREVHSGQVRTTDAGAAIISFRLPEHIEAGDGQLSIIVDDGGTRETLVRAVPIQLGKVLVDFYPEGGDLVADLENRVYCAARNPLDKPVRIAGQVLDSHGREVARATTVRDGLGSFRLKPTRGERYVLKITEPLDVTTSPELPRVMDRPLVLDTGAGVFGVGEPLSFTIRARDGNESLLVTAHCRGSGVGQQKLTVAPGENTVSLPVPADVGGVVRVTIWDAQGTAPRPLAERLVFRRHERRLNARVVEQSAAARSPGEPARLTLQVTDEQGQPAAGVLGVAVVDDGALSLADRKTPALRTHFLLTSEIHDPAELENADFYLTNDKGAAEALDLLLGTQGWRRFAECGVPAGTSVQSPDFRAQLQRLVALDGTAAPATRFDNLGAIQSQVRSHAEMLRREFYDLLWCCGLLAIPLAVAFLGIMSIGRMRLDTPMGLLLLAVLIPAGMLAAGCGREMGQREAKRAVATGPQAQAPAKRAELAAPASAEKGVADEASLRGPAERRAADHQLATTAPETRPQPAQPADPASRPETETTDDKARPIVAGDVDLATTAVSRVLRPDELHQLLASRGIDAGELADKLLQELRFPVREYAHRHARRDAATREDFAETLYWHPLLLTDADGRATVRFDLSDSVTTFRVLADAHGADGRIGSGGGEVVARLPFQLEPKLPLEVTMGDRIELPVAVINNRSEAAPVELEVQADSPLRAKGEMRRSVSVAADGRRREHFTWEVTGGAAETMAVVHVRGRAGTLSDAVRRELRVASSGYPVRESYSGVIEGSEKVRLRVPSSAVPGSLEVTLRAYPSPLADLLEGLESILQEPHGCFEQASSSNYPNTLTLRYLEQQRIANPQVTRRAKELLDRGYKRLSGFECKAYGYEWFGQDPGHEALSAFGLLQFHDMKAVFPVDATMVARTLAWLLERRDGQGSFRRNPRHLHQWSVRQELVDAYILWALTEAGEKQLDAELNRLAATAETCNDAYRLALSAAALINAGKTKEGERLLAKLATLQAADGHLDGKESVTQSGGLSLTMETTALAALAWLKVPQHHEQARRAVAWIVKNRQGRGGFGSTQATVLCLKALVAHADKAGRARSGGKLTVLHHGEMLAEATLPSGEATTVELTGLGRRLPPGDADLELQAPGYGRLPYSLEVAYHTPSPPSDEKCPVRLTTRLAQTELRAGQTVAVEATLRNVTAQGQPMTVAIVGLPGGLEPQTAELTALRDRGLFDYYELRPREVIFYWRTLPPSSTATWQLTLTAAIPGSYTAPASRAYLYYTAEQKHWVEPLHVTIAAE
jgi:hypothetical protein